MLSAYRGKPGSWSDYERLFLDLLAQRQIERSLSRPHIDGGCLLCSEAEPHHCHRRLVAEYLARQWGDVKIVHLQ